MQGTYVGSNGNEIGCCGSGGSGADTLIVPMKQGQGDDCAGPAQARQG